MWISKKNKIQCFKKYIYLKPSMIYYTLSLSNIIQYDSKYNNSNSPYIQEIPHNKCPIFMKIHPCPLLNTKEHFFFEAIFEIM